MRLLLLMCAVTVVAAELVDLTHYVKEGNPIWPTHTKFKFHNMSKGLYKNTGVWVQIEDFMTSSHYSTHVDAPAHMAKDTKTIDQIPVRHFFSPAVIIDLQQRAKSTPNALLTVSDILSWEERNGRIPDGAAVLIRTGWSKFWHDSDKFLGRSNSSDPNMAFPGFSGESAEWLVTNRKIYTIGSECVSIDAGDSTNFPAHVAFAKNDVMMIEMVGSGVHKLPEKGALLMTVPLKNQGASGSPIRLLAAYGDDVKMFQELVGSASTVTVSITALTLICLLQIILDY